MNRRIFLLSSSAAAMAQSPSEKVVLGLIGAGGRGKRLMTEFKKDPSANFKAICDIYEPNLEAGLSAAGPGTKAYRNYKQLLEDPGIQAVVVATPDHWHATMVLDAVAAGKDVYIEKPVCHKIEEGKRLIEGVRATDRIVQVGMQRRSYNLYQEARDLRRQGRIGTVRMVRTFWLNHHGWPRQRRFEGPIDWEQWTGPAGASEKDPNRFFNWVQISDYSHGIVQGQGVHIYDSIHMVMDAGWPLAVNASANEEDLEGIDRPVAMVVIAEYPQDFMAIFTINYTAMRYESRSDQLNSYDGDLARMDVGRELLHIYDRDSPQTASYTKDQPGGFERATIDHAANFLQCIKTRQEPNCPIEDGVKAALIVQLGDLSVAEGRKIRWDANRWQAT